MPGVILNGENTLYAPDDFPATGGALLARHGLDERSLVVEVDRVIIPRGDFADFPLHDGQVIELVRFVGGG